MRRRIIAVVVSAWLLVLVSAVPALAQPSGEVKQNADQAAESGSGLVSAAAGFIETWAKGEYGWVLGLVVIFIILRFAYRLVRG